MRVLHVSDFFPPVRGGLETHVDDLAAELADRGHDVHVATLTRGARPVEPAVTVHEVPSLSGRVLRHADPARPFAPPLPDPVSARALARLVERVRPDVVHAHSWLGASLPHRRRPPVVVTAHDYALVCQLHTLLRTSGERCPGPHFATCVGCGAARLGRARSLALTTATAAGRRLLPADRVLTLSRQVATAVGPFVRVPVDVVGGFVRPAPDVPAPDLPAEPFVMYAGDPGEHKGLQVLLDLWAAGDMPAPLLVASTRALEVDVPGVHVTRLDRAQVAAAWRRATLAVVPSLWDEPYGMVAVEALTAGVPVVASAVGALPELVRADVDGVLVPPGDRAALRSALVGLLSDAGRRAVLAAAAAAGAERFTPATVVPRVEASYVAAVDARREVA